MRFEFATATRIIFGPGTLPEAAPAARVFGRRALIVTGANTERSQRLNTLLAAEGLSCRTLATNGEPTVESVTSGAKLAREEHIEVVIGFGGGSALDAAKAIAALATNSRGVFDYLEVIGRGQPLTATPLPCITIPTTAGTGSEVTRNAVLGSSEHRLKVSLRSPLMLPRLALVDPDLTLDLPPGLTASTGLDALTQLIEPYLSCRANPMTDALCVEGLRCAARSLRTAFRDGSDRAAREDMALASLFSGLALANAGLGAVHGLAGPIGGMFPAPHGAVCAALLPRVMTANLRALRSRAPRSPALTRFGEVTRLLAGQPAATADDGVRWLNELVAELQIAPLKTYGIAQTDLSLIAEKASQASSMKGNPIELTRAELTESLSAAL